MEVAEILSEVFGASAGTCDNKNWLGTGSKGDQERVA
jgi:hypothetical protein